MPLIEFLGLPASGKTTVARELAARLEARGWACRLSGTLPLAGGRNLPRKLLRALVVAVSEPSILVAGIVAVMRSRQRRPPDAVRVLLNLLEVRYVLHAGGRGIVIMDQGPAQAIWSLAYSARRPTAQGLRALMHGGLPRRHLVVELASSGALAAARSSARGTRLSRIEREEEAPSLAWARAVQAMSVVTCAVSGLRRVRVANPQGGAGVAADTISALVQGVPTGG